MSKSDSYSRSNALNLAASLAGELAHDTADLVLSAAKKFDEYVSNGPAEAVQTILIHDNSTLKLATTESGRQYAAGFALGSDNAKTEQTCPHCAALDAALLAAGLPGLDTLVTELPIPKGAIEHLHENGFATFSDVINGGPVVAFSMPADVSNQYFEFFTPVVDILVKQANAEDTLTAPIGTLPDSDYSGFPLNHFENLTPATVAALNAKGALTIGDVSKSPKVLAGAMFDGDVEPGQLVNLLRHVVTNLTHCTENPELSPERVAFVKKEIGSLSTAITALEQINKQKAAMLNGEAGDIGGLFNSLKAIPGFGSVLESAVKGLGEKLNKQTGGRVLTFEQFIDSLKAPQDGQTPPTKH